MGREWPLRPLGEFVRLQRGHDLTAGERTDGKYPVMGSAGPNGTHGEFKARGPGVVVGRSGASAGRVHYCPVDYWPHNTCLYVTDFLGNDPRFVHYCLGTLPLAAYNSGSAQPSLNRNFIYTIPVAVPSLREQREVSGLLGGIDDRIGLLRQTNATLEAIAQALFKSWFVDFDPVHAKAEGREPEAMDAATAALFPSEFEESKLGPIPKGWRVAEIGEVALLVKGRSYKSAELNSSDNALVTLKSFNRGGGFRRDGFKPYTGTYKNEQIVREGECIVAFTDVTQQAELIGRAAIVTGSGEYSRLVASLDVGILRSKAHNLSPAFLRALLSGDRYVGHIKGYTTGTTVLHLAKDGLLSYPFAMPPDELIVRWSEIGNAYIERQALNVRKIDVLADLRDTLLPRLISGKLRLPEATEAAETALA